MHVQDILQFRHNLLISPEYWINTSLENIDGEIWSQIENFEGYYSISNLGRIKSHSRPQLMRNGRTRPQKEVVMKQRIDHRGYLRVVLNKGNIHKLCLVHRAVGFAFIDNPENKKEINHIFGRTRCNVFCELEWNTGLENQTHARRIGLINQNGENSVNAKFKNEDIINMRLLHKNNTPVINIAAMYSTSPSNIYRIVNRERWKHI